MSIEEVNIDFKQWNPMENDYKNKEFNQYISGPGAELDVNLQLSQETFLNNEIKNSGSQKPQTKPCLVFMNLPKNMGTKAVRNICSKHGRVVEVRNGVKNPHCFVDLATVADMEAVLRALENNNYGFKVSIAKTKEPKMKVEKNPIDRNFTPVPPKSIGIDLESRNFRTSKINNPRPKVKEDSLLIASDAVNTGLPLNLLSNDAHSLERQGLYKMPNNDKFSYRIGRSYVNMPKKTKQFIDKKHKESLGNYIESKDKYVHAPEMNGIPDDISKCSQCNNACDTVCERCSQFYCSVDCQLIDWAVHRYKCGKPKHLEKIPPSKKELQTDNKSFRTPKENNKTALDIVPIEVSNKIFIHEASQQISPSSKSEQFSGDSNNSNSSSTKKHSQQFTLSMEASRKLPNALNFINKKLPASLRALQQSPNVTKKSHEELATTSKSSQKLFKSSSTSQSGIVLKPFENIEIFKQNMPRSGGVVTITSIIKTNVVFIRSITYENHLSYLNTVDSLQSLGKTLQPLETMPKNAEVVIAKLENQFNRALVLNANNSLNILIHFIDYGNMEHVRLEDLFKAPKEFISKPRHAIPVLLKNVAETYMTQEIRQFMHTYLNNINVEVHYKPEDFQKNNNIFAVDLIDENTQQNLNKIIMKLSKPVEPQTIEEICDRNYLKAKLLPTGNNIEFIVMDNSLMCSGCISCTTKPYAIEIEKFTKAIQDYIESIPKEAYTPRAQELCIAQYSEDGLWYRGLCIETVGDGYPSIHFIDYGNITVVPIDSIRRYPRQFTFPIYTFDCAIKGLPEICDDKLVTKLEDLIPNGQMIKCENVVVEEENFYLLSLPNVINELTKCGLIND